MENNNFEYLNPGDNHYKAYVGPPDRYDFMGATQFRLLTSLGLRASHKLLDFGCGSLRSGKLFIPYLNKGNYYGLDPNKWLVEDGIDNELGKDILKIKKPNFSYNDNFKIDFNEKFDFIVAQSIFSHTSLNLVKKGLSSIFESLNDNGIALFTFVEGRDDYKGNEDWVYPNCTTFKYKTIKTTLNETGAEWRRLFWFHPAQTWYIMSKNKRNLPSYFDIFFLLGGEEVLSKQYQSQKFISNRIFSFLKK
jgi:cyclopropane fatty-acyl-phospholipid synthase-like methyltransferase